MHAGTMVASRRNFFLLLSVGPTCPATTSAFAILLIRHVAVWNGPEVEAPLKKKQQGDPLSIHDFSFMQACDWTQSVFFLCYWGTTYKHPCFSSTPDLVFFFSDEDRSIYDDVSHVFPDKWEPDVLNPPLECLCQLHFSTQTDGHACLSGMKYIFDMEKTIHLMLIAMLDSRKNEHWNQTIDCWIRRRRCRRSKHPLCGPWRCLEETGPWPTSEIPWSFGIIWLCFWVIVSQIAPKRGPTKACFTYVSYLQCFCIKDWSHSTKVYWIDSKAFPIEHQHLKKSPLCRSL